MKERTPEEIQKFVDEAMEMAIANLRPIVPPKGLTKEQEELYMAIHNAFRPRVAAEKDAETPQCKPPARRFFGKVCAFLHLTA